MIKKAQKDVLCIICGGVFYVIVAAAGPLVFLVMDLGTYYKPRTKILILP